MTARAAGAITHDDVQASTERLLGVVRRMSNDDVRAPSRLPGWTRGHVLAHLARNAEGLANLVEWARTGEPHPMYPSRKARDADIKSGAARRAADHAADLERAGGRLAAAWAALPGDRRDVEVPLLSGATLRARSIPLHRLKELEIHQVDLDAGYTAANWPADFTALALDDVVAAYTIRDGCPAVTLEATDTGLTRHIGKPGAGDPTVSGEERALLAWATQRSDADGLGVEPDGQFPTLPSYG